MPVATAPSIDVHSIAPAEAAAAQIRVGPAAIATAALGIVAGVAYGLSPLSVWCLVVVTGLIVWTIRDSSPRERRWLLVLTAGSILLRGGAILWLAARADPMSGSFATVFGDARYAIQRGLWIRNAFIGSPISPRDFVEAFDSYGQSGYHSLLAVAQVLLGPAPYGVHVLSATLYVAGALVLYRLVRTGYGRATALAGLALTLYLPTLFLWSISPLKESAYFFFMAVTLAAAVAMVRACRWPVGVLSALMAAVALSGIYTLRAGGFEMAVGGLAAGACVALVFRRRWAALAALAIAPLLALAVAIHPATQTRALAEVRAAAARHLGHVRTPGSSYRLLDSAYYHEGAPAVGALAPSEAFRYVVNSVTAFVLVPKPWELATRSDLWLVPQQLVWYGLVVCALPGLVAGFRRDTLLTSMLAAYVIVGVAVIAPNSGNVGTLIRHRDMVAPFLVWVGALGAVSTISSAWNWSIKRRTTVETEDTGVQSW